MKNQAVIRAVKHAAKCKVTWPGCYPLIVIMSDGQVLCCDCARSEFTLIGRATRDSDRSDWNAAGVQAHMEGEPIVHEEIREMIERDVMLHRWHMDNLALRMGRESPVRCVNKLVWGSEEVKPMPQKAWIAMQPKYGRQK